MKHSRRKRGLINRGKTIKKVQFSIYRYNPDVDAKPRMQDYTLEMDENQVFSLHVPVAGMLLKCFDFKLATKG